MARALQTQGIALGQMGLSQKKGGQIMETDTPHSETKANRHEEEAEQPRPLQDAQVEATIADATFRQKRDALVAAWRDWLHYGLQNPGAIDLIKSIHAVMDSMDDFLNHRSRK
jgi:hypothetical protein